MTVTATDEAVPDVELAQFSPHALSLLVLEPPEVKAWGCTKFSVLVVQMGRDLLLQPQVGQVGAASHWRLSHNIAKRRKTKDCFRLPTQRVTYDCSVQAGSFLFGCCN